MPVDKIDKEHFEQIIDDNVKRWATLIKYIEKHQSEAKKLKKERFSKKAILALKHRLYLESQRYGNENSTIFDHMAALNHLDRTNGEK